MNKFDRDDFEFNRDNVENTNLDLVEFDGKLIESSYFEFTRVVTILASSFGLGGCKSFSEYADMINNEDPALIDLLLFHHGQNQSRKYASEEDLKDLPEEETESTQEVKKVVVEENIPVAGKKLTKEEEDKYWKKELGANTGSESKIADFLVSNGVSKKELKKYQEKVSKGKIKIKEYDFSRLDSKTIASLSPKEYEQLMKNMSDYSKQGKNFKINLTDFGKRKE